MFTLQTLDGVKIILEVSMKQKNGCNFLQVETDTLLLENA